MKLFLLINFFLLFFNYDKELERYKKMKKLLKKYNFIIGGSNNHWYMFPSTRSISILNIGQKITLVDSQMNTIKEFKTQKQLKTFLNFMFNF